MYQWNLESVLALSLERTTEARDVAFTQLGFRLLGGSRAQIRGPTGAFVVIIYGIVHQYGYDGLAVATLIAGGLLILMGLFRMGGSG